MSGISSGVGLASGINSRQIIDQLLALDARGKTPLQTQIARTQGQKTAMLDVNARLLGLRSASTNFRIGRVFDRMLAAPSNADVLGATAASGTPPGSYAFKVNRLVSTSQMLSRGFATRDATPLGLTEVNLEWGRASIGSPVALSALRGGEGVGGGGVKITDANGGVATIDLSGSVTLQDAVTVINANDDIAVTASIENERLVVRDTSGGSGSLVIANALGGTIATRFGIVGTHTGGTATGSALNQLGMNSSLSSLNDGAGVLIRDGAVDFRVEADGTVFDIDLGRKNLPITTDTKLSDLNNGVGVRINTTDADDFTVVTSTGVSVGVNLGAVVVDGEVESNAVTTVGELLSRVNSELSEALGSGQVVLSLRADGRGFNLTDNLGGASPLKVQSAGPNTDKTAKDLGIFTGAITTGPSTIVGSVIQNKVSSPRAATIQDVATRVFEQTGGAVRVEINSAGTGISLVKASGGGTVSVLPGIVDGSSFGTMVGERTARDLGIFGLSGTTSVEGTRVSAGIGTVRTGALAGGQGIAPAGPLIVTDRAGVSFSFNDFAANDTLDGLVRAINAQAETSGVGVRFELSTSGRSLVARDSSGGTGDLLVKGDGGLALGFDAAVAANSAQGADLERRHVSLATTLSSLNFGKGIGTGTFRLTDSSGASATVEIASTATTLYDVVSNINSRGLLVEARLNSTGDGITLVDLNTGAPANPMEVQEVSGSTARGLGILGKAATAGANIEGSLEKKISFAATDTLNDVVTKINASGFPVSAAVINTGGGGTPFRISLTSQVSGAGGELLVESIGADLGLFRTVEGKDAALVLGGGGVDTPFVFTSASNTFKDVLSGLEINAKKTGDATVEVTRDLGNMVDTVKKWTTSITEVLGRIAEYDKYDSTTQVRSALFGDSTVAAVRQQLVSQLQRPAKGIEGQFRFLSQVGITLGTKNQVSFNEAKFREAYERDPNAVKELFAGFEIQASTNSSPVDGVTIIEQSKTIYKKLGFGDTFDQLLNRLTNTVDGATTVADRNFQKRIEQLNQRIRSIDDRIAAKRTRYERQFIAMETAIARVQSQQGAVAGISAIPSF